SIKQIQEAGIEKLVMPYEHMVGEALAADIIDQETGEILFEANTEITSDVLVMMQEKGITSFEIIYTNDLDCGDFISSTLRADQTSTQLEALVEIYRVMRPGEPPTREAADNLFKNLF